MSANLDKSLDDIIASKPKSQRRRSGGVRKSGRARVIASAAASHKVSAKAQRVAAAVAATSHPLDDPTKLATRIIISNLV
jgi:hypothetical protein